MTLRELERFHAAYLAGGKVRDQQRMVPPKTAPKS